MFSYFQLRNRICDLIIFWGNVENDLTIIHALKCTIQQHIFSLKLFVFVPISDGGQNMLFFDAAWQILQNNMKKLSISCFFNLFLNKKIFDVYLLQKMSWVLSTQKKNVWKKKKMCNRGLNQLGVYSRKIELGCSVGV